MGTINVYNCKHVYTFLAFQFSKLRFALFETGSPLHSIVCPGIHCVDQADFELTEISWSLTNTGIQDVYQTFLDSLSSPFCLFYRVTPNQSSLGSLSWAQLAPIRPTSLNVKFCQSSVIKNIPLQFQIQIPRKESSSVTDRFHRLRLGSGGMVLTLPVTRLFEVKDKHSRNPSALHLYTKQEAGAPLYCERSLQ